MGKRKSSKKVVVRRGPAPLDKTFRCLFCQHPGTVTCKLDKASRVGRLDCKNCGQNFQASITHLTQPIDVYSDWIDETEAVNKKPEPAEAVPRRRLQPARDDEDDQEDGNVAESSDVEDERPHRTRIESDEELPEA